MAAYGVFWLFLLTLAMVIVTRVAAFMLQPSMIRSIPYYQCGLRHTNYHHENVCWYHRRRSRCSMAMAEDKEQEQMQTETEVLDDNSDEESSSLSSCPFSKTFPRYRIDLTTSRKKKHNEGVWSLIPSIELPSLELPSPPWKEAMQKDQIDRSLRRRQKRKTGNDSGDFQILIQPSIDGISAFAYLWEESARLMGMGEEPPRYSSSVIILGLPDASQPIVRNFCEIVEWMGTTMADGETKINARFGGDNGFVLDAEFIKEENLDIPTVRLERIPKSLDQINRDHNDSRSSVTAETVINERTRLWVKRILVEQGICPFTRSDRMSGQGLIDLGVPQGSIAYHACFQKHPIGLFADTWKAIDRMIEAVPQGRTGVSSILLAAPEFDEDFDAWAGPVFAMLEAGVVAAGAESQIGVVCFHPRYATPDGKSWPGFGHMHSVPRLEKWYREISESSSSECPLTTEDIAAGGAWQRRTPHATINVLRADQLEAAESRRVSNKMYTENINKLVGTNGIGNEKLALDLQREREEGASQL